MPTSVIEHIRRVVGDGLRDGELLGRYVDRRDEAALAALVHRHAPMVWGVCRRQLSHHDAEDAFQATFIVLVRKAASIAQREAVGNWLYGVAHQAALQARRSAARRRAREVQVTEMPDAEAPQEQRADLQPFLDEELSRLPDHYRTVIVLSDLEGRTRKEVAAQLGCPEGTVASRLVRARSMLAKRLTQRGVALSGGALAVVLSQSTGSAGVPAAVVSSTIKAASLCAAGQAAIPVKVAALAEGVLKAMLLNKLKPALAVLVVVAMVGLIGYGMARGQQKGDAEQKQASEPKAPKDAVVKEKAEKEDATAWGKEVDGLQAGLAVDSSTCRQGEMLKLTVNLRNVGKAEVTVNCGILSEWAPQVTTDTGGRVTVYTPPHFRGYPIQIKRALKPGETITLETVAAVESEDRAKLLGEIPVWTPTICAAPGKYKIVYGGMIQSHPKLATGTVEFEVKPAERITAWGKELGGLQAGLSAEKRAFSHGETVKLVVRVRNVSKEAVKFKYIRQYLDENPPIVTDADGKAIPQAKTLVEGLRHVPVEVNLEPGKETVLETRIHGASGVPYELRPAKWLGNDGVPALYGKGKFQIQYERVFGSSSAGRLELDPKLEKLATGKLELEVKEDKKPVEPKQKDTEAFTEWGKEVGGLQAGLGFRPGEQRAYTHGETVTLFVRVRTVNKKLLETWQAGRPVEYIPGYFFDWPPSVTDGEGKPAPQIRFPGNGRDHNPKELTLAQGKEVELAELKIELRPESESGNKKENTLYGTGKFQIQYERLMYSSGALSFRSILRDLATGKLELEIKSAEKK